MIGTTVAHFKITGKLGEGGMGEVYRATDTRLEREVAIKVLPETFTQDPERLARFEREAKVLASLNHPYIAGIHGLEEAEGKKYLILELIEGETLAEQIEKGPIPVDKAMSLAQQMATGMEAAHEQGIVHRDLKPANIKITPDGQVKILDFGLAKGWEPTASSASQPLLSQSPTLTAQMTGQGVILGTAAYMSPEQARGEEVDKRADIWSFGIVLFEMLSGKSVYTGRTVSDVLAGILAREPEWESIPKKIPPALTRLLRRCLAKESADRLRDVGEARILLGEILAGTADEAVDEAAVASASASGGVWRFVSVALLLAGSLLGFLYWRQLSQPKQVLRASIPAPEGTEYHLNTDYPGPVAVSPDGRKITFTAIDEDGEILLWVRDLDATAGRPLAGTEEAQYPFWSPDSRSIAFSAGGKLKRVEVSGTPPLTLCDAPVGKGGTWNEEGVIVFSPSHSNPLHRVSAAGGESTPVTEIEAESDENSHRHPHFLPDGNRFLYLARTGGTDENRIKVGSLDESEDQELMLAPTNVRYVDNHLLFVRETTLMARPFDPNKLEFNGDPFPIAENVSVDSGASLAVYSVSEGGMLAYQIGEVNQEKPLLWVDRNGLETGRLGDEAMYSGISLAPNGERAVVGVFDRQAENDDLWIYEIARGLRSRFTFAAGRDVSPIWSSDGKTIYFSSDREGDFDLYSKSAGGGEEEVLLLKKEENQFAGSVTPDGKHLIFTDFNADGSDVWVLPLRDGGEAEPLLQTEFREHHGIVSPNGRWIAYSSSESGSFQVYVTSFPKPAGKWQISQASGRQPIWRQDGREIVFRDDNDFLMAAEVEPKGDEFRVGEVKQLFQRTMPSQPGIEWSMSVDAERFLLISEVEGSEAGPIHLVLNWQEELKKRR
jgi:Tol biopolymer transport system component